MPSLINVNVYLMSCLPGQSESIGGPVVVGFRPAHDTAPDHMCLLTESEEKTLRRRVADYLALCRGRRVAESSENEVQYRLTPPGSRPEHTAAFRRGAAKGGGS